jgi:succinoglycan biosynthesis transport protein ExoP
MQFPFNGEATLPASSNNLSGPLSEGAEPSASSTHSLREIWAAAYRSRFWIIGIFAACIALAIVAALLTTRLYQASASVEVRQEAAKVLGTEADQEQSASTDAERFLQTQLDIIRSRGVAEAVAEREGLFNGSAFLHGMGIEDESAGVPAGMTPREAQRDRVLKLLRGGMSVRYTGTTRIATISFTSPDPRLSARIANAFADAYIRSNLSRKAGASVYALDFLRGQLNEAQARLAKSEQAVVNYGRRTRIVDAGNAAGSGGSSDNSARPQSLITAQLVQLNQAYSTAIADRIAAQQKWAQISALPALSTPDVLNNNAVQLLLERRADIQGQYQQQLATRQEDYPTVAAAKAQLRELDRQIGSLASNIRSGIRNAYQISNAREQQLANEIDKLKNSTLSEQNQGIELSILRREADTNRQQYEALLRRFNSLNAESGIQTNNLSIVDRANVPDRSSWPRLSLNLAVALILGMLLSALFVFLREQLFNAIRTPDEVRTATGMAILGVVPSSDTPEEDLDDPKSVQSDAYNSVRTSLSLLSPNGVPATVMFTSTQQGEGKSTACRALALSLSRLGRRVIVVDADLRRPNVHRLFGLPNRQGLSNLLSGQIVMEQAIHNSADSKIDFIVAGDIPPNPTELINSAQMVALLRELRNAYDIVLVDSAPVLGLADAVILSSEVEATVYVIESGRNPVRQIQASLSRLAQSGGTIAGAVLVKFDPGRSGYGYGTEYGYSYDYADRSK